MSFFRHLVDKIALLPEADSRLPNPEQFRSVEEYAHALCWAGVDADKARELIRDTLHRLERERQSGWREAGRRDREAEALEARRESTSAAARRLLRDCGYYDEDDTPPPPGSGLEPWQRHWRAYDTSHQGSHDYDPLRRRRPDGRANQRQALPLTQHDRF